MLRLAAAFVLIGAFGAARPAIAQTTSCQPVFDAMLKEAETPHHVVSMRDGQPTGELISTQDGMYVKVHGAWRKSPLTPQGYLTQQQENIKDVSAAACQALPDEVLDGVPASVYHARYDMKRIGPTEAKVWIAKSSGLPIRTDESLRGGEHIAESHRFDYAKVAAPPM